VIGNYQMMKAEELVKKQSQGQIWSIPRWRRHLVKPP